MPLLMTSWRCLATWIRVLINRTKPPKVVLYVTSMVLVGHKRMTDPILNASHQSQLIVYLPDPWVVIWSQTWPYLPLILFSFSKLVPTTYLGLVTVKTSRLKFRKCFLQPLQNYFYLKLGNGSSGKRTNESAPRTCSLLKPSAFAPTSSFQPTPASVTGKGKQ